MRKGMVVEKPTTPMNESMEGLARTVGIFQPEVPNIPFHNPKVDLSFLLIEGRGLVEKFPNFVQEMHKEIERRMHECV